MGKMTFIGGHVNNVVRLSKMLAEKGHEIHIITTPHRYNNGGNVIKWAKVHTLSIYDTYLSIQYILTYAVKAPIKVNSLSKKEKFDVIHGHSGYLSPVLVTALASKLSGIPAIHTLYCTVNETRYNNIATSIITKLINKCFISKLDRIIAATNNVEYSLLKIGVNKDKLKVIHPLVDTHIFNSSIRGNDIKVLYGITNEIIISYVGNLSESKGLQILLKAIELLKNNYKIKLFMVLNMPLEIYQKPLRIDKDMNIIYEIKSKIKELLLEDVIVPIGLTENMAKILAASDLFVMPFLDMVGILDYPLSLLEAMAIGKPVIVTNIGGISEIIRHNVNGLFVNPGDHFELADAIRYIIEHKERARVMGRKNSEKIMSDFKPSEIVCTLERIYEEVNIR